MARAKAAIKVLIGLTRDHARSIEKFRSKLRAAQRKQGAETAAMFEARSRSVAPHGPLVSAVVEWSRARGGGEGGGAGGVRQLSEGEVNQLRAMFKAMDKDKSGYAHRGAAVGAGGGRGGG